MNLYFLRAAFTRLFKMPCSETLDYTNYFNRLEHEFKIDLWDDPAPILTLDDLVQIIARLRRAAGHPTEPIWPIVQHITSQEMGVDAAELHPAVRFVEDLRICF